MYLNLEAEIARRKLTAPEIADAAGMKEWAFSGKRNGKTEFTLSECKRIRDALNPELTIEYLFEEDGEKCQ